MPRRRPLIFWVRTVHRWTALFFVALAAVLIVGVAPLGTPAGDGLSTIAIVALLLLIVTGLWVAIHHYTVQYTAAAVRRRRSTTAAPAGE